MARVAARDGDPRTKGSEARRDRQADAGAAASDDGNLILQEVGREHDT
jgi:hypothetical protein